MSVFSFSAKEPVPEQVNEVKAEGPESKEEQQALIQSGVIKKEEPVAATTSQEKQPPKPVEIVLTGPLSHIYTQALNALLAKEDSISTYNVYDEYERKKIENEQQDEDQGADKSYVYVASGHNLEQSDVVKAYSDIVKFKNDFPQAKVVVGLESDKGFSRAANSFDRCMTDMGVKTYYKPASISNAISSLYQG